MTPSCSYNSSCLCQKQAQDATAGASDILEAPADVRAHMYQLSTLGFSLGDCQEELDQAQHQLHGPALWLT